MDTPALPGQITLRPDLCFRSFDSEGTTYTIEDPLRNVFFRVGEREYRFLCRLAAGKRPAAVDQADGEDMLPEEEESAILQWLARNQLLLGQKPDNLHALEQAAEVTKKKKRLSRLNLIVFRVSLGNPDPLLDRLAPWLGLFTGPLFFLFWLGCAIAATGAALANWEVFFQQGSVFFSPGNLLMLTLVWVGLKILHELSHALACKRYGGRVYDMGILFILFIPLTYVNVSSSWAFASRWQRIHVAVAGIYIELFVAAFALLFWSTHQGTSVGMLAWNTVIVAGVSSLLFNANPLMRFDGYYILSDLLKIPNLYSQGMATFMQGMRRLWLGIESPAPNFRPMFLRVYGFAIFFWRIIALCTLGYLANRMFQGWGVLITAGAAVSWGYVIVTGFVTNLTGRLREQPEVRAHFVRRLVLAATLFTVLFFAVQWRQTISIPAVVVYDEQYMVRAPVSGFVERIVVQEGDEVNMGDLLLELDNEEIEANAETLALEMEALSVKRRIATVNGDLVSVDILNEQKSLLSDQHMLVRSDLDSMHIAAPGQGTIVSGALRHKQRTWVEKGEELLQVVDISDKHIIGLIDQDVIGSVLVGYKPGDPIKIYFSNGKMGKGRIQKISPTATTRVVHPALAAPFGGALDVRHASSSSEKYMLLAPRFTVAVKVHADIALDLRNGQRVTLYLEGDTYRIGHHLYTVVKRWFEHHVHRSGND